MENEKVDTKRAEEWLRSILEMDGYTSTATDQERIEVLLIECSRLASRVEELEKCLRDLVVQLKFVHDDPDYEAVWCVAQLHRGPYTGLKYAEQLENAESLLAQPSGNTPGKDGL